jgi:hypothetical protein
MIIPVSILVIILYFAGTIVGIRSKNTVLLITLNAFMWLGAFVSALLTWAAWDDRGYSENWGAYGFILVAVPFIIITCITVLVQLFFIRNWAPEKVSGFRKSSVILIAFLLLQLIIGIVSTF